MSAKRWLILLAVFFIFNLSYAQQQNLFGFKGDKAELQQAVLHYFAGGQITDKPDKILNFGVLDTYDLMMLSFDKLTYYIYENVRIVGAKLMCSTAGMQEREIDVNIIALPKDDKWGKAFLACEFAEPVEVEYIYDSQSKNLVMQYTINDWDNTKYKDEQAQKIIDGLAREVEEYENNTTPGIYLILVNYLIK